MSSYETGEKAREAVGQSVEESLFDGSGWVGYQTYVRLVREASETHEPRQVRGPGDVYKTFATLSELDRERFYSVHLDSMHQVCGLELVTQGTLDSSLITPRELFKAAILSNAAEIILVHNHPSGDPNPSPEDRSVTNQLQATGVVLGIPVLDHIIIGDRRYFSFSEANLL